MLFETAHVWVERANRIATLWLNFPGYPVNRLNAARIAEIGRAIEAIRADVFTEILVLRSAKPAGFCGGFEALTFLSDGEAYAFAEAGRRVCQELADIPVATVAFLEGPCRGGGLELALACDTRLAVASPDAWLELGPTPCWGGSTRLRSLTGRADVGRVTAREAVRLGFVDHAFCQRRAKIELRSWLDRLEMRPRKRRSGWWQRRRASRDDARELRAFVHHVRHAPIGEAATIAPGRDWPTLEFRDCPQAHEFAAEYVLRGGQVRTPDSAGILAELQTAEQRGRVTPLEREQASLRVRTTGHGTLVLQSESSDPFAIVRATLHPHTQPVRLGFPVLPNSRQIELTPGSACPAIAGVIASAGYTPVTVADSPSLDERTRLVGLWDEAVRLVADGFPVEVIDEISEAKYGLPLLRMLDTLGVDRAVSLVPRLRSVAGIGLHDVFYHPDRPDEPNSLAQTMLSAGPRLMIEDEDREELDDAEQRQEIAARLQAAEPMTTHLEPFPRGRQVA